MSWTNEQSIASVELMEPDGPPARTITLQDFMELTGHLPRETTLHALVFDDDDIEYSRRILSAAVRIERRKDGSPLQQIELKVEPEF